jgi:hypothetical protein
MSKLYADLQRAIEKMNRAKDRKEILEQSLAGGSVQFFCGHESPCLILKHGDDSRFAITTMRNYYEDQYGNYKAAVDSLCARIAGGRVDEIC